MPTVTEEPLHPTLPFTERVADYASSRPGYPDALYDALWEKAGLGPGSEMADLGSGTGISAEPLLERGAVVFCVEPNDAMRQAAETALAGYPKFQSVAGTAERTGLAGHSVDFVMAAQAFHWFDQGAVRLECARILRPGGSAAII